MQLVRLRRGWPGAFRRRVLNAAGEVVRTLVWETPGEALSLSPEELQAVHRDLDNALELATADDAGRPHTDHPVRTYAHALAEHLMAGLLDRGQKVLHDAIRQAPHRVAEILLDGVLPLEGIAKNLDEVAAALGIERAELDELRKDKAHPMPGQSGRYDLAEVAKWAAAIGLELLIDNETSNNETNESPSPSGDA